MSKCPLYGKCSGIDKALLSEYSDRNLDVYYQVEYYKFDSVVCSGRGKGFDHWSDCPKYKAERDLHASNSSGSSSSRGGCYIATCVYGSYDCPEVWTLRRYRDKNLEQSVLGRWFIRVYYAIGPKIVRLLENKRWFHMFWRSILDRMVNKLQYNSVDSSPYKDN